MGLEIGGYEKVNEDGSKSLIHGALTIDRMSSNVILVMEALARNESIFKLLYFKDSSPFKHDIQNPILQEDVKARNVFVNGDIKKINSVNNKITPLPFNPEAQENDEVFIRIYYNQGSIGSNEIIHSAQMHIDIICAKSLWLVDDEVRRIPLVRPYALMSRVMELVGNKNDNNEVKVGNFVGFQHLSVNNKFECIRMYYNTMQLG